MKHKLIKEGNESVTKCNQLKLTSPKDGKRYSTDVADMGLMFRIIESIPSKKAEPFKQWMTTREYKKHKGLTKENLRDNMTNTKLLNPFQLSAFFQYHGSQVFIIFSTRLLRARRSAYR